MSNTAAQFAKIWSTKLAKVKRVIRRLPRDVGNEALRWFIDNFRKQQSPEGQAWKSRKDGDGSRSLLVQSGRLRKSIRLTKVTSNGFRIGSSVPYADYHNSGTRRTPQRQFLGRSAVLMRRLERMIKAKILWSLRG
ncbi:phage virion morphogenesis protein [Chryseolinea sp. T2]|uniref:phage virion morphogenesis protein n=1 Tax=Chryseolinea sp. T2 TaxID=3129255 RepID=UPI003FCCF799